MRGRWKIAPALALAAVALSAILSTIGARPAAAADPFYTSLLRDGQLAFERGELAAAAKSLRLACFGLLDEPQPLTACLVRLAVAQGAAGDDPGFQETFRRLAEVEERFGTYAKADLPADLRAAFEQRVATAVPAPTLAGLPAFAGLIGRKVEAQLSALPPKQRRKELGDRLAKAPKDPQLNLLLAELDLQEGHTAQALPRAEQVAVAAPSPRALCVRGLARSRTAGRCTEAVADLEPCAETARRADYAAALLGCWLELRQPARASQLLATLPPALRGDREVARLAAQIPAQTAPALPPTPAAPTGATGAAGSTPPKAAGPPAPRQPVAPSPAPAGSGVADPPTQPPAAPLAAAERQKLTKVRQMLDAGGSPRELKSALQLAREVADAHPQAADAQLLAAEAAYRNSRWADAVTYFRRGGDPGDERPELLFYMAVADYEAGDRAAAAEALKRALPKLQPSDFVDDYRKKILGTAER